MQNKRRKDVVMSKKPVVLMVLDGYGLMIRQREMRLRRQIHRLWTNLWQNVHSRKAMQVVFM